jgi:hypothetical protein
MKRIVIGVLTMLVVLPALDLGGGVLGQEAPLGVGGLAMLHHAALADGGSGARGAAFAYALQVREGGGAWGLP